MNPQAKFPILKFLLFLFPFPFSPSRLRVSRFFLKPFSPPPPPRHIFFFKKKTKKTKKKTKKIRLSTASPFPAPSSLPPPSTSALMEFSIGRVGFDGFFLLLLLRLNDGKEREREREKERKKIREVKESGGVGDEFIVYFLGGWDCEKG